MLPCVAMINQVVFGRAFSSIGLDLGAFLVTMAHPDKISYGDGITIFVPALTSGCGEKSSF